jgi:CRP-like cAMP-binding protein
VNIKLSVLQKSALFKEKSFDEIEVLLSEINFRIGCFAANETIFSPVQNVEKMGIILSGTVDVQKLFPTGKVIVIERKKSSDMIAESSIFSRLDYYSDTFVACMPCQVLLLSKRNLLKLFELDDTILLNYLESVSNSTLILKHKIGILSLASIQEKIAGFLLHHNKHAGVANNDNTVTLPFSKKVWAEYMNVSRTSLSRELRALQTAGIISFEKRTIKIEDRGKLEKILSL